MYIIKKAGVSAGSRVKRYLDRTPLKRNGGVKCRYTINIYRAGMLVKFHKRMKNIDFIVRNKIAHKIWCHKTTFLRMIRY